MERRSFFSNRSLVLVIVFVTLVLLIGSTILQRIVFKAEQVSSAVFLNPSSVTVRPDGSTTLSLEANLGGTALVAGSQFVVDFNPALLQLTEAKAADGWQTTKLTTSKSGPNEELLWALLPNDNLGPTVQYSGPVNFGTMTFAAVAEGTATVTVEPRQSIIVGIDANHVPSMYNAVSTVQNSVVTVSQNLATTTAPAVVASTPVVDTNSPQKILTNDVSPLSDSALLFVGLRYQADVAVRFGTTKDLSSTVQSLNKTSQQVIQLAGLTPSTQYYYQLVVTNTDRTATLSSNIRSFTTVKSSTNPFSATKSELRLFPLQAKNSAIAYIFLRDENGNAVSSVNPKLTVSKGQATISNPVSSAGLSQQTVISQLPTKQQVSVTANANGQEIGSGSVQFDPNFTEQSEPKIGTSTAWALNTMTVATLAILSIIFVLLTVVFIRLSRVK